jgi:uncharacterized protein YbjT (DUF2867 family)
VLPRLAARYDVRALARSEAAADRVEQRGASVVRGTLEKPETWITPARESEAVVHLAGMRLIDRLIGHLQLDQPLTVISSASVLNPAHPGSGDLRAAESRLTSTRRETLVILRPTMIYGSSFDRNVRPLARLIARLPAVPKLTGGGLIQPVLADDVADAVVATLGRKGGLEANLGGPSAVRLGDLVGELARLLNRPVVPFPVPVYLLAWAATLVSRWRPSRGAHAWAMLLRDRVVPPADGDVIGHATTSLADGLVLALSRYPATEIPG